MASPTIAQRTPYATEVKTGQSYKWCSCGMSKTQPFCDASHKGSEFKPVTKVPDKDETVKLCGCKHTKNPPFCDGSHKTLP